LLKGLQDAATRLAWSIGAVRSPPPTRRTERGSLVPAAFERFTDERLEVLFPAVEEVALWN